MTRIQSITVSVPAKVILFGEHAVVHGTPAIAGAVDRRTRVQVTEGEGNILKLQLDALQIEHEFTLPLENTELPTGLSPSISKALDCCRIVWSNLKVYHGFNVKVTSDFPLGAGLGSSASVAVAMAAAVVATNQVFGSDFEGEGDLNVSKEELDLILSIADKCERVFHGNPSGIDAATCALGGIIRFQRGEGVERIAGSLPIKLAIVDSKVDRDTGKIVQGVKDLQTRLPTVLASVLKAMHEVADAAVYELRNWCGSSEKLLDLVKLNQGLLYAIGVSHPALEKIGHCMENIYAGFKLTGAGGGGNAIIFIPPETLEKDVCNILEKNGYKANVVNVGVKGLEIFID